MGGICVCFLNELKIKMLSLKLGSAVMCQKFTPIMINCLIQSIFCITQYICITLCYLKLHDYNEKEETLTTYFSKKIILMKNNEN